jgi:predicted N-formylglutamate amidohydrolase
MPGDSDVQHHAQSDDFAPRVVNPAGRSPVLLVCEHASAHMPAAFDNLGLGAAERESHIAWDPGAFDTARHLSTLLDAPLVHATVSRLIYDCNRPPLADSAIPERSEATLVPGNENLSDAERQRRVDLVYRPFETLLAQALDARPDLAALVTVHSFTPVYLGHKRTVEIGMLHDTDSRLADAMLAVATGYETQRNAPYGPTDGVTHTLRHHALPRGLMNVMIEIRNDLIATPEHCAQMAQKLAGWLREALEPRAADHAREAGT